MNEKKRMRFAYMILLGLSLGVLLVFVATVMGWNEAPMGWLIPASLAVYAGAALLLLSR